VSKDILSGRSLRLLRMLYAQGSPATTYTLRVKQSELAKQLAISRQALNVHLRKLRDDGYIRTGRGFIDVTEKGLGVLGGVRKSCLRLCQDFSPQKGGSI